jgi:hypothetical protein
MPTLEEDRWTTTFSSTVRDGDVVFTGGYDEAEKQIEDLAKKRGYDIDIDRFTDQIDVWKTSKGRRRRWLILMA